MTAMIDVVFLLLIFFLVSPTLVAPERQHKTNVKTQRPSANPKKKLLEPAIIDIKIINGVASFRLGDVVTQKISDLQRVLQSDFPNEHDGAFVRASDKVTFDLPVLAINACKNAGFTTVTYIPLIEGAE